MDKLALYSSLITGGLGTGYNLYQGDTLKDSLIQGSILGTVVGGGMYGANKLYTAPIFDDLQFKKHYPDYAVNYPSDYKNKPVSLETNLLEYLYPHWTYSRYYDTYDDAVKEIAEDVDRRFLTETEDFVPLDKEDFEELKDIIDNTSAMNSYYNMRRGTVLNDTNTDYIMNNIMPKVVYGTGGAVGVLGGTTANSLLFKDKQEKNKENLINAIKQLQQQGVISNQLDSYLTNI
jgi:hypothetical protein